MAERLKSRNVETLQKSVIQIYGSFLPNGSSAIDNDSNTGEGFTVTREDTGQYKIVLDQAYNKLLTALFQLQLNSAADANIQIVSHDVTTTTTGITIENRTMADSPAAEDIASNANNRIYFQLVLSRSSKD